MPGCCHGHLLLSNAFSSSAVDEHHWELVDKNIWKRGYDVMVI